MSSRRTYSGQEPTLAGFRRYAGPATLILASLADGAKHGYALTKDIDAAGAVVMTIAFVAARQAARTARPGAVRTR